MPGALERKNVVVRVELLIVRGMDISWIGFQPTATEDEGEYVKDVRV